MAKNTTERVKTSASGLFDGAEDEAAKGKTCLSIWCDKSFIDEVGRYATLKGINRSEIIKIAVSEFMKKHPVTDDEKKAYMEKMGLL